MSANKKYGKPHLAQAFNELQLELLLMKAYDDGGIGYLALLETNRVESSDLWYWHGAREALGYTNAQFKKHVHKLRRALEAITPTPGHPSLERRGA